MEVLRLEHEDFTLVIQSNESLTAVFNRSRQNQQDIFTAAVYAFSSGELTIYDFSAAELISIDPERAHPVIFENRDYFIDIDFREKETISSAKIHSRLRELEEKFFFRPLNGSLRGTINFGNNIGKSELILRYSKNDSPEEAVFQFDVFPSKLDFRSDYTKIVADIEQEYPYLVMDFLRKTYSGYESGNAAATDLTWWQIFAGLYTDFIRSSNYILHKPHSRIIREAQHLKAEQAIRRKPKLEEVVSNNRSLPDKRYHSEQGRLTANTSENQFFKHAVVHTLLKYTRIKSYIEKRFSKMISPSFKTEMNDIRESLEAIAVHPFFRSVGDFKGIRQESNVLHRGTGYSSIYGSWLMLNKGIAFLEGLQKIELKNIAELYQMWCFLEIKEVVQKLLHKERPDSVDLSEIQVDDFIFRIERGIKSKVTFVRENGDIIELLYDVSYSTVEEGKTRSYTGKQCPDIVLKITKNDLKDNYALTYIYDAKYRLASDTAEDAPDVPPEDAINQMHRYRDAIYYVNEEKDRSPQKEVIGAYVLFPGKGTRKAILNQLYHQSIGKINIGAFPLRPNDTENRELLENHLRDILCLDTESTLDMIPPHKETTYETSNPNVLIGFMQQVQYNNCIEQQEHPFYYTGGSHPRIESYQPKYFAPYVKGKGVNAYYEITGYERKDRNAIFPMGHELFDVSFEERLVIRLGKKTLIGNGGYVKLTDTTIGKLPYRYAKLSSVRNPEGGKIVVEKGGD